MTRAVRIAYVAAVAVAVTLSGLPARSAGAAEGLLRLVPKDWPVIVRIDASENTASGAYLKKQQEGEDAARIAEWNAAFNTGLARMMAALGLDVPPEGKLFGWAGEAAVFAMDPRSLLNSQPNEGEIPVPGMVLAVECRDRQKAERELLDLVGSVIRDGDPATQQAGGATLYIWKIQQGDRVLHPAYAVTDGAVLMAESADRLRQVLESPPDGPSPALAEMLALHADDLVAFAVDLSPVMQKLMPQQEAVGEQDFLAAMFGMMALRAGAHGGLSVSDEGMVMNVQGDIPPVLMGMLGPMMGGAPSSTDIATLLPANTLAVISTGSPGILKPMLERRSGEMLQEGSPDDVRAAVQVLSLMEEGSAGLALTGLIPRPNYVMVCKAVKDAQASELLSKFREGLPAAGMRAAREPQALRAEIYRITRVEDGRTAGFAGILDGTVFFASDWRSAQKLTAVSPATCLAVNRAYADVRTLLGGPRMLDAWISLEGVAALGWLYESLGMSELASIRMMTDALKATRGVGISFGLAEGGAEMRMALRTKIGPQPAGLWAYIGGMVGALTAGVAGQAVMSGSTTAEQESVGELDAPQDSLECLMELVSALKSYAQDHEGQLPDAENWKDALHPYVDNPMAFVSAFEGFTFSYNPKLAGLRMQDIINPQEVVAFAETRPGSWPTAEKFDTPDGKLRLAFLDGRVVEAERMMGNPPKVRPQQGR
ncbi:MAG: hypothetical protein KatS3mg024_2666 [Armatimonadota bacterium]|nr:MAG: hypothetical protein KatS3mg024_2666 [Armatimonadota bacterium]